MCLPFITAMIVVRNEEQYIEKCFRSLLEQSYPPDCYEILIIDGMSEDQTLALALETQKLYGAENAVRYIKNPKKLLAAGWNLGIQNARGEFVVRIDAHGYADRDFLLKSVETALKVPDAICVGGAMKTEAISPKGELIAEILSSPFGVGNSKFRYSQKALYVDTVAFGLYHKSIFEKVGFFDETLQRNQDNDMHRRIRAEGGKFYLNPEIKTVYYARNSVRGLLKQGYQNGKWNIITFRKDRESLSLRHLVPLFFVLATVLCLMLGVFYPIFLWLILAMYGLHLLMGFYFGCKRTRVFTHILAFPWLCLGLHVSYGAGSLIELFHIRRK